MDIRKLSLSQIITSEYNPPASEAIIALYCFISDLAKKEVAKSNKYVIKKFTTNSTSTYITKKYPLSLIIITNEKGLICQNHSSISIVSITTSYTGLSPIPVWVAAISSSTSVPSVISPNTVW